jgi:hypothetical protein
MARLGSCGELKGGKDLGFATWVLRLGWGLILNPGFWGANLGPLRLWLVGLLAHSRAADSRMTEGEKRLPPHAERKMARTQ